MNGTAYRLSSGTLWVDVLGMSMLHIQITSVCQMRYPKSTVIYNRFLFSYECYLVTKGIRLNEFIFCRSDVDYKLSHKQEKRQSVTSNCATTQWVILEFSTQYILVNKLVVKLGYYHRCQCIGSLRHQIISSHVLTIHRITCIRIHNTLMW